MNFFDTNVLIAASIPDHPYHAASHALLARLTVEGGACGTHSLAEAYATLTHLSRYGIPPSDALRIVDHTVKTFTVVSLTIEEYVQTIDAIALKGARGPVIYDALLVACARKVEAEYLYTHNIKRFRQVAPDLAWRIVEP